MHLTKYCSRAALCIALLAAPSVFASTTWKIDAAHSNVLFSVTHMVINQVNGWFADFEGAVTQANDVDFNEASVVVHIKTTSINTSAEGRDKHLRGPDFFDADKYPVTTFTSTRFKKIKDNDYDVTGILDLHGVQKPVQLQAHFNGFIKNYKGVMVAGFKATTTINRYDFNLKWNKALEAGGVMVSENVDLTLNLEIVQQ